jgi:hypothetical protein
MAFSAAVSAIAVKAQQHANNVASARRFIARTRRP